jgi:hypothetical protein
MKMELRKGSETPSQHENRANKTTAGYPGFMCTSKGTLLTVEGEDGIGPCDASSWDMLGGYRSVGVERHPLTMNGNKIS